MSCAYRIGTLGRCLFLHSSWWRKIHGHGVENPEEVLGGVGLHGACADEKKSELSDPVILSVPCKKAAAVQKHADTGSLYRLVDFQMQDQEDPED